MVEWKILKYGAGNHAFEFILGDGELTYLMGELDNKQVLGVADEAQRKSIAWDNDVTSALLNGAYIGSVDCVRDMIVFPKGNLEEFAIVLGSKNIQLINEKTTHEDGALVLSRDSIPYGSEFEGDFTKWFKIRDLILNEPLTFDEYMDHDGWGMVLHDPRIEGMPEEIATHPNFKEHFGKQMWSKFRKDVERDKAMEFIVGMQPKRYFTQGMQLTLCNPNRFGNATGIYVSKIFDPLSEERILAIVPEELTALKWAPKGQLETRLGQKFSHFPKIIRNGFKKFISNYSQ